MNPITISCFVQIKELKQHMFVSSIKDLHLDEVGQANYTLKTVGAAFWALRRKEFRGAIQEIVMEVGCVYRLIAVCLHLNVILFCGK